MARTNIQVVITVKDGATRPLENVQKGIRNTGKAARDSTADIWQFNKTLFSTFAFVGLFTKGFSQLKESLTIGAELDRVSTQFEKQVGPKSKFIQALQGSTNVVIDEMTALSSGLKLSNLGITKGLESTAETIAKFAVAGRMAGKKSEDVISGLTDAVTEGNVARLEELGIMKRSDPAYMALMAVIGKTGGVMGGVIAKQQAMAIVMGAINKRVQGQMFAFMSLGEVIDYTATAYNNLRRNIGVLLGNAVRPLLEKLLPLLQTFNKIVEGISRTDKHTLFLVKTILSLTAAAAGLFATLGSLKLLVKLLGYTPLGFGGMATAILAVTAAFVGLSREAQGPLEKLKMFGAFFKGIYELVTNFDPETGISKMSKATRALLAKGGILSFVEFIAAAVVTVKTTIKDIADFVTHVAKIVDTQFKKLFGGIDEKLKGTSKWTTWWTTDTLSNFDKVKRAAIILGGVIGTIFLGKKLFGLAGSLLSKIPVIGGMFGGGGGKGPKGTPTDPIYTVGAGIGGGLGGGLAQIFAGAGIWGAIKGSFGLLWQSLKQIGTIGIRGVAKDIGIIFKLFFQQAFPTLFKIASSVGSALKFLGSGVMWVGRALMAFAVANPISAVIIALAALVTALTTSEKFMMGWMEKMPSWMGGVPGSKENREKNEKFATPEGAMQMQYEHAQKMGWSKGGETLEQYKSRVESKKVGKQTSVSVPSMDVDQESTIQALGEQMKSMDSTNREKMQESIQQALENNSSGGALIDPEEFANFQKLLTAAFDESKNLKELVRATQEKKLMIRANQRG
jgi:hypothetical protein